jgi:hypothetical protein
MATQVNKNLINLTELDFDDIKSSLKTYLKSQDEFVDFDFEGAGINILLDLLANNTAYSAFLANMLINESFLDTAVLRKSVVSSAKHIAYTPNSIQSATALLDISILPKLSTHEPAAISLPRGTKFKTTVGSKTYSFITTEAVTIKRDSDGKYLHKNLKVTEGALRTIQYVVDTSNLQQRFSIPDVSADVTSLRVTTQASEGNLSETLYTLVDEVVVPDSTTNAYWLQENDKGAFDVVFGDGVVGSSLQDENVVTLEYLISKGSAANGLTNLSYTSGLAIYTINNTNFSTNKITVDSVVEKSSGGADAESIESIKFIAPRYYEAQNRAVTARDYRTLITKNFPFIETVAVWGGEDNVPVDLGSVYVSLKPYAGTEISTTTEDDIVALMNKLAVVTIDTKIVDPEYIYLKVTTDVKYDPALTIRSGTDIETLVFDTIADYGDNTLEKFDRDFRYSQLSTLIDNTEVSILNNLTDITLQKRYTPTLNTSESQTLDFNNELLPGTISSTGFTVLGIVSYYDDVSTDGFVGVIRRYSLNNDGTKTILDSSAGTIDYVTGDVTLESVKITATSESDETVRIDATPKVEDVVTDRNQILLIDRNDIVVVAETDKIAT